jgi:hypothetical protein
MGKRPIFIHGYLSLCTRVIFMQFCHVSNVIVSQVLKWGEGGGLKFMTIKPGRRDCFYDFLNIETRHLYIKRISVC